MSFRGRKEKGLEHQHEFEALYTGWTKYDLFNETDFETTTSTMPAWLKYKPDYQSGCEFCECKDSWYYEEQEWEYHLGWSDRLWVWTKDHQLVPFNSLNFSLPKRGSKNGSGLPYRVFEVIE